MRRRQRLRDQPSRLEPALGEQVRRSVGIGAHLGHVADQPRQPRRPIDLGEHAHLGERIFARARLQHRHAHARRRGARRQRHPLHTRAELDGELLIRQRPQDQRHRLRRLLARHDLDGPHLARARLGPRRHPRAARGGAEARMPQGVGLAVLELARRAQPIGARLAAGVRRRRREAEHPERRPADSARRVRRCAQLGARRRVEVDAAKPPFLEVPALGEEHLVAVAAREARRRLIAHDALVVDAQPICRVAVARRPRRRQQDLLFAAVAEHRLDGVVVPELGARVHHDMPLDADDAHLRVHDR